MSIFNVVSKDESLKVNNVNILIYGEPSAGKTSTANTSANCLTLDFDKGSHRSAFRKDVFVVESWKQITENQNEFNKLCQNYDTIVIDTADSMLEFMGVYAIAKNSKLAFNKLQWYGAIKDMFSQFVGMLKTMQKDIIFIAHVKEKDEGDYRVKRPAIMGGSYDKVLQVCDFVGFASFKGDKRTLNFNPSEYHVGKNSAKLPLFEVPDFAENPLWFDLRIAEMKNSLNEMNEEQRQAIETLETFNIKILDCYDIETMNNLLKEFKELKKGLKPQIWVNYEKRAKDLGLEYKKATDSFQLISNK